MLKGTLSGRFNACPVQSAVLCTICMMLKFHTGYFFTHTKSLKNWFQNQKKEIQNRSIICIIFSPQVPLFPCETERVWC